MTLTELLIHVVGHPVSRRPKGAWEVDVAGNCIRFWPSCEVTLHTLGIQVRCDRYRLESRGFCLTDAWRALDRLNEMIDTAEEYVAADLAAIARL